MANVRKLLRVGNSSPKQLSINKFINPEHMTPRAGLAHDAIGEEKYAWAFVTLM
jgi:hypothetical protein